MSEQQTEETVKTEIAETSGSQQGSVIEIDATEIPSEGSLPAVRDEQRYMSGPSIADKRTEDLIKKFERYMDLSRTFVKSGVLPNHIKSPEACFAIIARGHELGLPPMTSANSIYVVDGKTTMSGQLMLALCMRDADLEYEINRRDAEGAEIVVKRPGKAPQTFSFDKEDAKRAGLLRKSNWKKYPTAMYWWRAVSDACRSYCPDVVTGMYTPEEIASDVEVDPQTGDVDEWNFDSDDTRLNEVGEPSDIMKDAIKAREQELIELSEESGEKAVEYRTSNDVFQDAESAQNYYENLKSKIKYINNLDKKRSTYFAKLNDMGIDNREVRHDFHELLFTSDDGHDVEVPESNSDWGVKHYKYAMYLMDETQSDVLASMVEKAIDNQENSDEDDKEVNENQ